MSKSRPPQGNRSTSKRKRTIRQPRELIIVFIKSCNLENDGLEMNRIEVN